MYVNPACMEIYIQKQTLIFVQTRAAQEQTISIGNIRNNSQPGKASNDKNGGEPMARVNLEMAPLISEMFLQKQKLCKTLYLPVSARTQQLPLHMNFTASGYAPAGQILPGIKSMILIVQPNK